MVDTTTSSITVESPLGRLTMIARAGRLLALRFTDRGVLAARRRTPELEAVAEQLGQYFQGRREEFDLPLRLPEDRFDRRVLEAAGRIPYGERSTYGALTAELGLAADRARDVGAALGRNPVPILIPCHRVVGADGRLTGYGGGLERKALLLELEAPQLQLTA